MNAPSHELGRAERVTPIRSPRVLCSNDQIGMYEGVGFVNRRFPDGGGAGGAERARVVQETVVNAGYLEGFASGVSPERGVQVWQARLPRHVFALRLRMTRSVATTTKGSISSPTRRWGSCRSSSSLRGRVRTSRRLGFREATDLTVAEPPVGQRENLAGVRDTGFVLPVGVQVIHRVVGGAFK